MRLNANTSLGGAKCVLVPYREEHVNTYHCWMQDPELQEATASEPLTLDEEFAMQRAWRDDADKLTFIVLDRRRQPDTPGTGCHGGAMAGDVNLFFIDDDDDDVDEEGEDEMEEEEERERQGRRQQQGRPNKLKTAEVEVMIAEPESRRGGLATEALRLLMAYAVRHLGVGRFVAKIGAKNTASLALFSGGGASGSGSGSGQGLGFVEFRRVAAFDEVHLALDVSPGTAARAELEAVALAEAPYDDDGGDEEGEGAAAAAEDVLLDLGPGGARPGALPAVALPRRGDGDGDDDEERGGLAPDALARRLAAVAGASNGGDGGSEAAGGDGVDEW